MRKVFIFLLRYLLFWVIWSVFTRIVFILWFHEKLLSFSLSETLQLFISGLIMDFSLAGYISAVPFLVFLILRFIPRLKIPVWIPKTYTYSLIIISSLINMVNVNIYREWNEKISYRVIYDLITSTKEALLSASSSPILLSLTIMLLMILTGVFIAKKIIDFKMPPQYFSKWKLHIPVYILIGGIIFLFIRGGWGVAPLNPSMAYFSPHPFLNHAAVNTDWYLLADAVRSNKSTKNPYVPFDEERGKKAIEAIYSTDTTTAVNILKHQQPNVIIFILESYTAGLIESLGGEKGITPHLEKIISEGVLFSNIYASSDRSDKGIIATLSAFPAQGKQSIIKSSGKHEKLPGIGQEFSAHGYSTSFYYGGESSFYNFKSYMFSHGFNRVVDQHHFKDIPVEGKWGVYDHITFQKHLKDMDDEQTPFFSTIFTLNNHEPFDLPGTYKYGKNSLANMFRSTAHYTDSILFDYINQAKQKSWYSNTLFVIIADHGHRLPLDKWDSHHPERYRIPLIMFGDVIKPEYKGLKVEKTGSQTDMVATLFNQIGFNAERYIWSKDLLNPSTQPFALFNWSAGVGVITDKQSISFDKNGDKIIYIKNADVSESENQQLLNLGNTYMQQVYNQFMDY